MKTSLARDIRTVLADSLGHFNADDGWSMASHVALSALMAIFPFIIFVAALAGFLGQDALVDGVADLLFETWPEEVAGPIAAEVKLVVGQAGRSLLTVSAVVALFLASNGIEAARTALNRAYRVVENRSIFWLRGQSLMFVMVGAASSLGMAMFGLFRLTAFDWVANILPWLRPWQSQIAYSSLLGTSLAVIGVLTAAHIWLPAGRPRWRQLWPGILLTLILWLASWWVFTIYLRQYADMATTYAGLAGVVTAIFFLYIIAVVLIYGAEFNAALGRLRASREQLSGG